MAGRSLSPLCPGCIRMAGGVELLGSVTQLPKDYRWKPKLTVILRTRQFNTREERVTLYKAQLLSFIDYQTAALYRACESSLVALDRIPDKLLEVAGASCAEVLGSFDLAPLSARRDMARRGHIHKE
eukprot:7980885-Pyramimonas_sp.AAC.1